MNEAPVVAVVGATRTLLQDGPPAAHQAVSDFLTVEMKGARFSRKVKYGLWDGNVRLYDLRTHTFPAGLTSRVLAHLSDVGFPAAYGDSASDKPAVPWAKSIQGITLTDHQVKAVEHGITERRIFIKSPTGSGKTEIGAELVRRLGLPALWIVHRTSLLQQTATRLKERLGVEVGMIGGSSTPTICPITVGMVGTLHNVSAPSFWNQWKVLVLDECHHASAMTWYECAMRCTAATWRFGLSATPLTSDKLRNLKLEGATGPLYEVADIMTLAAQGFLARPHMRMLQIEQESYPRYAFTRDRLFPNWRKDRKVLRKMGSRVYAEMYKIGISQSPLRNAKIAEVTMRHAAAQERVMILCARIPHALGLYNRMKRDGRRGGWLLTGKEKEKERQRVLGDFKASTTGAFLVATPIFNEGIDVPEIDVLFIAGGMQDENLTIQRVGRALRKRPDKDEVLIYDFLDGNPEDPKDYLALHTKERLGTYRRNRFLVERE